MGLLLYGAYGLLLLAVCHVQGQITDQNQRFVGWDCSEPRGKQSFIVPKESKCAHLPVGKTMEPVQYRVLQEALFKRQQGFLCSLHQTQDARFVGAYSHEVYVQEQAVSFEDKRIVLSRDQCWKWIHQGTIDVFTYDRKPISIKVVNNTLDSFSKTTLGYCYIGDGDYDCVGETVDINGKSLGSVTIYSTWRIETKIIEMMHDKDGKVTIQDDRISLSCSIERGHCETNLFGTYVWEEPKSDCWLYKVKDTNGVDVSDEENTKKIYVSKDKAYVRLSHGKKIIKCENEVISTQISRVFLTKQIGVKDFGRELHEAETSPYIYTDAKVSYLTHHVADHFIGEFNRISYEQCVAKMGDQDVNLEAQLATDNAIKNAESAALVNDTHITASAEIIYVYKCRRIIVNFRRTGKCWNHFPITLMTSDLARYISTRKEIKNDNPGEEKAKREELYKKYKAEGFQGEENIPEFCLVPNTRRLTATCIQIPCSSMYTQGWKTINGDWVGTNPDLIHLPDPTYLHRTDKFEDKFQMKGIEETEAGGYYSVEQIESGDRFSQQHFVIDDIGHQLLDNSERTRIMGGHAGNYQIGDMFQDAQDLDFTALTQFTNFLKNYLALIFFIIIGIIMLIWGSSFYALYKRVCYLKNYFGYGICQAIIRGFHDTNFTKINFKRKPKSGTYQRIKSRQRSSDPDYLQLYRSRRRTPKENNCTDDNVKANKKEYLKNTLYPSIQHQEAMLAVGLQTLPPAPLVPPRPAATFKFNVTPLGVLESPTECAIRLRNDFKIESEKLKRAAPTKLKAMRKMHRPTPKNLKRWTANLMDPMPPLDDPEEKCRLGQCLCVKHYANLQLKKVEEDENGYVQTETNLPEKEQ